MAVILLPLKMFCVYQILSSALNIINSSMTKVFTRKFTGSDESSTPMGIGKMYSCLWLLQYIKNIINTGCILSYILIDCYSRHRMRNVAALRRHFQLIPIQFVFTCDRFTVELHCNAQQLNNVKVYWIYLTISFHGVVYNTLVHDFFISTLTFRVPSPTTICSSP